MAAPKNRDKKPDNRKSKLKPLNILLGTWAIEGWFKSDPDTKISGWESYDWLAGGHFLETHWQIITIRRGHEIDRNEGIILIGVNDQQTGSFKGHFFDNGGNSGAYQYQLDQNKFNISNESYRFKGVINEDKSTITGAWERLEGKDSWIYWYDKKLTKLK